MRTVLLAVLLCTSTLFAADHAPSLLLNREGIDQLKQRIATLPAAKARLDAIRAGVDSAIKQPIELPPRGANWYHWYVCPEHGNRLNVGRSIGQWKWEHICPVDRKVFRGDPSKVETDFDGCHLASLHRGAADRVRDAGLLYQVTGENRYADAARDILLAYANKYADYPLHTIRNEPKIGGGKIGSQTLDESVWLIPVAQGADLIWGALSEADRQTIATKLLLPAARDVILPHKLPVHNIQCWKNSAVGLVGFLLKDKALISAAIDDPAQGYRNQLAKGVLADGPWWEGAWGYHFYTMSALWPLTEAARNNGIDLYGPEFRKMFDAPLNFVQPDMVLPPFNDSGAVNLVGQAPIYELAYARYKDPRYLILLNRSDRDSNFALYFGVTPLPAAPAIERASINYPASGSAILTRGAGRDATWLCLKYGPHGGGHGHPDKLSFVLYAGGQVVAPDPSITSYGSPWHNNWYKSTLSHNTLAIDEQNQKPAEGKCIAFGTEAGIDYAIAEAGKVHESVRFTRTVAMLDESTFLFIDQLASDKPHTLDIAYHHRGQWSARPQGQPWQPPKKTGYLGMADATLTETADPAELHITARDGARHTLSLAGGDKTQLITATGFYTSTADRVPMIIFRRSASATAYAWTLSLKGESLQPTVLKITDETGQPVPPSQAAAISLTHHGKPLTLITNPRKLSLRVMLPTGAAFTTNAVFTAK